MRDSDLLELPSSERGVLSQGEQKFDAVRQKAGFFLAPIVFLALWFFPIPGLAEKESAHRLLAVLGLVVTLWVTEAIPLAVTALFGPVLCIFLGVASAKEVFKTFADPIIFLFIGSFLLAEAIFYHGLNRRIAFQILGLKAIGTNPTRLMIAFGCITCVLSMWISNTTTVAMMLPVGVSILSEMARRRSEQLGRPVDYKELKFGTALMLMMAFSAAIGGLATPVGAAPNLIGKGMIEKSGIAIPFFKWMAFGVPLAAVLLMILVFYLKRVCPAEPGLLSDESGWIRQERAKFGPFSRGEKNVILAFGLTVTLWLAPGALAVVLGTEHDTYKFFSARFPEATVALLGAILLFALPVNFRKRQFTLTWNEAKRIDWGTILLFGGGITLGELMFATGLAEWLGKGMVETTNASTTLGLVILFAALAAAVTQGASNTASASMLVPVAIAVSQAADVNPLQPALAACLGAGMGCMLPVSTPPNAIAYGSGCIPIVQMIKHGFVVSIVGVIAIIVITMWLVPLVF